MHYRAVGNRCAADLVSFVLPVSVEQALGILAGENINLIEVDIISLAKSLVGKAGWLWAAREWQAPSFFDCSSFTKWLYGEMGIWIPRRPQQQFEFCREFGSLHSLDQVAVGDILFLNSPYRKGVRSETEEGIGHVCVVSGEDSAICATNSEFGRGVVELPMSGLLSSRKLVGVGRIAHPAGRIMTFVFPSEREVETSDDIRWIVLQNC